MDQTIDLCSTVNELHEVRKQIETLTLREGEIKEILTTTGLKEVTGTHIKVLICAVAAGSSTDWKKACSLAKVKQAILDQCKKVSAGHYRITVKAL